MFFNRLRKLIIGDPGTLDDLYLNAFVMTCLMVYWWGEIAINAYVHKSREYNHVKDISHEVFVVRTMYICTLMIYLPAALASNPFPGTLHDHVIMSSILVHSEAYFIIIKVSNQFSLLAWISHKDGKYLDEAFKFFLITVRHVCILIVLKSNFLYSYGDMYAILPVAFSPRRVQTNAGDILVIT